jgi:hypothetical protein
MRNRSLVSAKFSQPQRGKQKVLCRRRRNPAIACQALVIFERYLTESIAAQGMDGLGGKLEMTSWRSRR